MVSVHAQSLTWEPWVQLVGAVDVGGPRRDGSLAAMAAGRLFLVAPDGTSVPFAGGPDGYSGSADAEPYFVVAPTLPANPAGCSFAPDDIFVLDPGSPTGIIRVDSTSRASRFASFANLDFLSGIAFDTTGRFGFALLVTGQGQNRATVVAVDCLGAVTTVTDAGPLVEGGIAVAPAGFGDYGGYLIAPDELSGQIWAISPDGTSNLVAVPDLPTGGDTGVESVGFVPAGLESGGYAYLADRGTPDNPFPGTDSILRVPAQALFDAGVQTGDLLVATEGDGLTVAIHCDSTCTTRRIAAAPNGHIEGHIVFGAGR